MNYGLRLIKSGYKTANIPDVLSTFRVTNDQLYRRKIKNIKKEFKIIKQLYSLRVIMKHSKKINYLLLIRLLPNIFFCN